MAMNHRAIRARLVALMHEVEPQLQQVFEQEPISIAAGSPVVAVYPGGKSPYGESGRTLGTVMSRRMWNIRIYARAPAPEQVRAEVDLAVLDIEDDIGVKINGDSELDGLVTDLEVGPSDWGYVDLGDVTYRSVTIPIDVFDLEGETIAR